MTLFRYDETQAGEHFKRFDQNYWVSNCGRVVSIRKNNIILLKPYKDRNGYLRFGIWKHGKRVKNQLIHIAVVMRFGDSKGQAYNEALDVDHLDANRQNNKLQNLELVTHQENIRRIFERE